jgi:hypothetical protein
LDGDRFENAMHLLRVLLDTGFTLDESLVKLSFIVPGFGEDDKELLRTRWQQERDLPILPARVLSRPAGPRPWSLDWKPSDGYHWRRLRKYLISKKRRTERDVENLDDLSDKVLSFLEDPRSSGPERFQVKGLVLGYIQSGKTANITALIAKAVDLGYKFVVVLSGIDDGLRKQTQDRLALELGLTNDPDGVGQPEHGQRFVALTSGDLRRGDFNPGNTNSNVLQGNERVIAVVKKNAAVLRRLVKFVGGARPDLPVLVIDDEADQASINTRRKRKSYYSEVNLGDGEFPEDLDPSIINGLIRSLVSRFQRVSYVAYTATPFANILIDPEGFDPVAGHDLYPRDFIVSLPKPLGYVGPERLFGRDALHEEDGPLPGLDVTEIIPDCDVQYLAPPRKSVKGFQPQITVSLKMAVVDFILATAAKMKRFGRDEISSMLIHTTPSVSVQAALGKLMDEYLAGLRNAWRYAPEDLRETLKARWESDFRDVSRSLDSTRDVPFDEVESSVDAVFRQPLELLVLNNESEDVLDYRANPTMKVVLIGGNRLSRGLTIENLVVSYYARNAVSYDTLLQMGRWFGYRERYVDLTRLWTTAELVSHFRHLALVEQELRDQIEIYEREGLSPVDFGPRIRTHPAMAVTAANKLGSAVPVRLSFSGQLRQTSRFKLKDHDWLMGNLEATKKFLGRLGIPRDGDGDRPGWRDVDWRQVCQFLEDFKSIQDPTAFDAATIRRYVRRQAESAGELLRWNVSVRSRMQRSEHLGVEGLCIENWPEVNTISRSRLRNDQDSVGVITNPASVDGKMWSGDEEVGLTAEQIRSARDKYRGGKFTRLGTALRSERDPKTGLMLIYPISRYSKGDGEDRLDLFEKPESACTVIGVAFVFPISSSQEAIDYIAGAAGVEKLWEDDSELEEFNDLS